MKLSCSCKTNKAMTLLEVMVVLLVIAVLIVMILPSLTSARDGPGSQNVGCLNNLKQIGFACRVWAGDHEDKYPMDVSVTDGGTLELCAKGNAVATFQVMSNELSTPKILYCRADEQHTPAITFDQGFGASNTSYFVGVDAGPLRPDSILSGDDNFQLQSGIARSGLLTLPTNPSVSWTASRHLSLKAHFWTPDQHRFIGNIGFADGSVRQLDVIELQQAFHQTGTNFIRLAIP